MFVGSLQMKNLTSVMSGLMLALPNLRLAYMQKMIELQIKMTYKLIKILRVRLIYPNWNLNGAYSYAVKKQNIWIMNGDKWLVNSTSKFKFRYIFLLNMHFDTIIMVEFISRPMLHFNEMYNKKGVLTILWMYVILLFYVINASPAKRVNYSLEDLLLRIKS